MFKWNVSTSSKKTDCQKTGFFPIDEALSFDLLDIYDCGPENIKGYRYILVVKKSFSNFWWTLLLENINAQTKGNSTENILTTAKRKGFQLKLVMEKILWRKEQIKESLLIFL